MNWGNIQNEWQTSNGIPASVEIRHLVQNAQARNRNVHRKVKCRDFIETTTALLVAPFFGYWAWSTLGKGLWVTAFASAFLAGWCLYVAWRLHKARRLFPDPRTSDNMLSYLKAERRATQGQYELLRRILWWYLGPCGFGVTIAFAGTQGFGLRTFTYSITVLFLCGLIYLLNQRAATRKFAPAIEQIDRAIEELSRDIAQGETT